jgi:protein ImuB
VRGAARRSVSADLAAPAATTEPVLFLVRAALDRLVDDLARDALGAAAVALTLHLDVGATRTVTREARLPRPLARVAPLFERCRALLERAALPGPVCGVTVSVPATGRLGADQGDLLSPAWHDPAAVEAAFARIRAELGPNVVVRAVARDQHRPERAGHWLPVEGVDPVADTAPDAEAPRAPHAEPAPAALRLLDPCEPADVEPDPAGAPATVHWRGRALPVTRADGPERLSGEWWADPYRRDYWRCATAAGLLLAYRDRGVGGWWVQGWYD